MRTVLVHDWLTSMRGGERVLERLCGLFPDAPIHTLLWNRGSASPAIEAHPIRTSFLQHLPFASRAYRWYLPMFPRAVASLALPPCDLVVSSSHCVALGVHVPGGTFHLSYIHTPMRYIWDLEDTYFPPGRFPWPASAYVRRTCARLRVWDVKASRGPDVLIANSAYVAGRIARHYDRTARVVHPPVDVARFTRERTPGDYYLVAGAFAPYKRADLALRACSRLGRRLVVAGAGQEDAALRRLAAAGIEFRGRVDDDAMAALYAGARALLYPGEEDFGIVPVEAMASGCPVIALGRGGALETVGGNMDATARDALAAGAPAKVPGGVLFADQTEEGLITAIECFEGLAFDAPALRVRAEPFAPEHFDRGILAALAEAGVAAGNVGAA